MNALAVRPRATYVADMTETSDHQHQSNDEPSAAGQNQAPHSPEQVMQAAVAHIADLEAERDEMKNKWMRAEAEMANLRTRTKREVEEARLYAVQKFARDVAEAAENLRRGLTSLPKPAADEPEMVTKLREGFEGVERAFMGLLERNGITRTDPTGAAFDANLHQAMAEQETAEHPPGTIVQAWTNTWTLNGRLLKPAMVVVSKSPASHAASQNSGVNTTA